LDDGRESPDKEDAIRVVDRRRFTEDGELRPDWEEPEPAPAPAAVADETPPAAAPEESSTARQDAPAGDEPRPPAPESSDASAATAPLFLDLVNGLAQQAALFLEGAQGFPADPSQAQRLIDYLGVLETKTRGNLSAEESQILSNIVFQLRALFVQKNP
jgi:hypothetical protein